MRYHFTADDQDLAIRNVFARFSAECENRTGYGLKYLDLEICGIYTAVDATTAALDFPVTVSPYYTLYFAQGDDNPQAEIDQHGIAPWLEMLYGATEFFTESQIR